jgi:UDP-glucose 4-epimerase
MKTILITGGLGYIGSHTVIQLLNQGYKIIIVDNCSNSNIDNLDKIKNICKVTDIIYYNIDICNQEKLDNIFNTNPHIYLVIHFAAFKSVPESISNPSKYYNNNLSGIINILNSMKKYNCNNLIFSSSATVYGSNIPPFKEIDKTGENLTNPYGETKYICEEILKNNAEEFPNMKFIILRYFNPVGAHKSGLIGEGLNSTNLMPNIIKSILYNMPFKLYGNSYNTFDGSCIRDFIHVEDLANAHIMCIPNIEKLKNNYNVYNVGTGIGYSILEIIDCINEHNVSPLTVELHQQRDGDIPICCSNIDKIKNDINWKPYETLNDICKDTINYINKSLL